MESNLLGLPYKTTSQAEALRKAFCKSGSLCTTSATACDLIAAQEEFMSKQLLTFLSLYDLLMWAPVVDSVYVTRQPIAAAGDLGVPLVLGTNHDEGTAFAHLTAARAAKLISNPTDPVHYGEFLDRLFSPASSRRIQTRERYRCEGAPDCTQQIANVLNDAVFTCPNRWFAIQATRSPSRQPLYAYQFTQVSSFNLWTLPPRPAAMSVPQCQGLVCHADELPYVFNAAGGLHQTFNEDEEALSQLIGDYWTTFARSHDPGDTWPRFRPKKTYRLLNESSSTADDPLSDLANCSLWDSIGYASPQILKHVIPAPGHP